jgi:cold shock CspA family protein
MRSTADSDRHIPQNESGSGAFKARCVKGYGFIAPDDDGQDDVFVHSSALPPDLRHEMREGDMVTFDLSPSPKRAKQFCADKVKLVS